MAAALKLFFIRVIWPWIVAYVWPILQQYIIQLLVESIDWLIQQAKDWIAGTNDKRAREATKKAEEAEQKAEEAFEGSDEYHAEKARANVWREVAEQYRRDNEELKAQLSKVATEAKSDVESDVAELTPELTIDGGKATLKVKGVEHTIPAIDFKKGVSK